MIKIIDNKPHKVLLKKLFVGIVDLHWNIHLLM